MRGAASNQRENLGNNNTGKAEPYRTSGGKAASMILQYKLKLYSNCMYVETVWPLRTAGTNRIWRAAAIAFSVKPQHSVCTARMFATWPVREKTTLKITVPVI